MVFQRYFSLLHCAHQLGGWGRVGKQIKVGSSNEEWERGEIVMYIAVPDTSILAKSSQTK